MQNDIQVSFIHHLILESIWFHEELESEHVSLNLNFVVLFSSDLIQKGKHKNPDSLLLFVLYVTDIDA